MNSIDERLLAGAGADKERQEEMAYSDELRQRQLAQTDRQRQAADAKQNSENNAVGPAKTGSKLLLRIAWPLMAGFITFIPGVFLADLHVFGRLVLGKKFFCDLGEEWPGSNMVNAMGPAKMIKGLGEKMALAVANLVALFIVIAIISLLAWMNDNLLFKVIDKATGVGQWIF